jgi:hypothetical protein
MQPPRSLSLNGAVDPPNSTWKTNRQIMKNE